MRSSRNSGLMAILAAAMLTSGHGEAGPVLTLRSAGSGNKRRPHQPKRNTALEREIADHNAAVEAKKQAKRDRKRGPTIHVAPTTGEGQ